MYVQSPYLHSMPCNEIYPILTRNEYYICR